MPRIQIKGIENSIENDYIIRVKKIQDEFVDIFVNSDRIAIQNLVERTKFTFQEIADESTTYLLKYQSLIELNDIWVEFREKYKHLPNSKQFLDHVNKSTDTLALYAKLFQSLSLMNQEAEKETVIDGFLLLATLIDVNGVKLSKSTLEIILGFSKSLLIKLTPENDPSLSSNDYSIECISSFEFSTQVKAFCTLIIWKIETQILPILANNLEFAEEKAIARIQSIQEGQDVNWVIAEPEFDIDIETLKERIKKRGYKV